MTRTELLIGAPIFILIAYPAVMRLLAEWVHPARLRLIDLERHLLASGSLTERQERVIHFYVDSALDPWVMARFAARFPKVVLLRLVGRKVPSAAWPEGHEGRLVDQFMWLSILSASAANPLFAVVVGVECLALIPLEGFDQD